MKDEMQIAEIEDAKKETTVHQATLKNERDQKFGTGRKSAII